MNDLRPTQQRALLDATVAPLTRTAGGWRGPKGAVHTQRTVLPLERAGLLAWANDERTLIAITRPGARAVARHLPASAA